MGRGLVRGFLLSSRALVQKGTQDCDRCSNVFTTLSLSWVLTTRPQGPYTCILKCKHTHTHTHTHIYIYIYKSNIYIYIYIYILLYGCTTWTLTKRLEKKLDGNYTRMLRAILDKYRGQHPTKHQLYGHLPAIEKTIQVRQTRHAGYSWRNRYELISDVLLWTPTYGRAKAGQPARTYIQQPCEDTGCSP